MSADLRHELLTLGFNEREARVYLALLRLGKSTAQTIAFTAEVPRASCYDLLERLVMKGLVNVKNVGDQREYLAEPPERLRTLLRLQIDELQERASRVEAALPFLEALTKDASVRPQIRFVKGIEELRELQAEFFSWSGDTLQIVGYEALKNIKSIRPVIEKQLQTLRQEKKKSGRAIMVTDGEIPVGIFETRRLPTSFIDVPGEVSVCGDRVLLFAYSEDYVAVEIRSPAIAQTCRALLELAWRWAGELEKKLS